MNYKVEAWSWCADYCKKNQWNPHDSYFWNKANLEYRRQHNIFEVGDKVVSRCADKEIKIFTYQETIGKNILVKCKKGKGYCYPKKWFSHANDAEIKAGKRLEVKSEN